MPYTEQELKGFSEELKRACRAGFISLYRDHLLAFMVVPEHQDHRQWTDGQWLYAMKQAGRCGKELEGLGYEVHY